MNVLTIVVSIIGILGTISSIFFAYVALKKNNLNEEKIEGKTEGIFLSDIGYIKACVDRVEKNLFKVDERYHSIVERVAKVEEAISSFDNRRYNAAS